MNVITIGLAGCTLFGMGIVMSWILGWANKAFQVEVDERVEAILTHLPGANCGGCGFVGCGEYAVAVVADNAPVNKCPAGGPAAAQAIAEIMGVDAGESIPLRAVIHCRAHAAERIGVTEYRGERNCVSAGLVVDIQQCTYGCLGMGDCKNACTYDAITIFDGLATIDYSRCIGCGACVRACPRNIISLVPFTQDTMYVCTCSNQDKAIHVKNVCTVGCMSCGKCAKRSGIITMENNLPQIDYDAYTAEEAAVLDTVSETCPNRQLVKVGGR